MKQLFNITHNGQSGNYWTDLGPHTDDETIRRTCAEAVRAGEVHGLSASIRPDAFNHSVIDRIDLGHETRYVLRPRVPFG